MFYIRQSYGSSHSCWTETREATTQLKCATFKHNWKKKNKKNQKTNILSS